MIMSEGFQGKKNKYTCDVCGGAVVTIDIDEGVTPFMLPCYATKDCGGTMTSGFYAARDLGEPQYEWRKPTPKQYRRMSPAMKDHVDRGGLELYPATQEAATASAQQP